MANLKTAFSSLMERHRAATTIQRMWYGANTRFFQPRRQQMEPQPLGHKSLGQNHWFLNNHHEFWSQPEIPKLSNRVTFSTLSRSRDNDDFDITEPTCLKLHTEKPSFHFAKIINKAFKKEPVDELLNGPQVDALLRYDLDNLFQETIASLERGQKVPLWDGKTTHIPISEPCQKIVRDCYEQFKLSQNEIPTFTTESQVVPDIPPINIDDLDARFQELLSKSRQIPVNEPLASQGVGTKTVFGVKLKGQKPTPTRQELDEKLQRIIHLH
tara:strand:- start:235 stop:1044 length:810 start_codon:yes stop_codon:yes gene_type:complete